VIVGVSCGDRLVRRLGKKLNRLCSLDLWVNLNEVYVAARGWLGLQGWVVPLSQDLFCCQLAHGVQRYECHFDVPHALEAMVQ